jgi:Plavaka transposase
LKAAAKVGKMLSDLLGWHWFCFTPLAVYIVNTLESTLVAGVTGKTSSVTMALYKQFGDNFRHEPHTALTIITQLLAVKAEADPWNLATYFKVALVFYLNGVHHPFWTDWPMSDPAVFLTPEPLHHCSTLPSSM